MATVFFRILCYLPVVCLPHPCIRFYSYIGMLSPILNCLAQGKCTPHTLTQQSYKILQKLQNFLTDYPSNATMNHVKYFFQRVFT